MKDGLYTGTAHIPPYAHHPPDISYYQRVELAASRKIEPFQQGEFDYLCGLYAAINAIRLARSEIAPLNYLQTCQLFNSGMAFLSDRGKLQLSLTWGMELDCRYDLAAHLAATASDKYVSLSVERADGVGWSSIDSAFGWIECSLADQKPVMVYIDGRLGPSTLDHYSVISGISAKTITLFDSIDLRFLRRSNCGLSEGRYLLPADGLLRIVATPPG